MALRKIKFVEHEIYHVYNRGNFKHDIFLDAQDYERFQKILYLSNGTKRFKYKDLLKYEKNIYEFEKGESLVNILAYVAMPNHFHLMIEIKPLKQSKVNSLSQNLDNNLSIFMKRVTSAYSMYFNRKYNRIGGLFESKFKAEHVANNNYFKYLFSYIHLNPIKLLQPNWRNEGIKDLPGANDFLMNYKYSSFPVYFKSPGKSGGIEKILDTMEFYNKIEKGTDLSKEIFDWLKFKTIT